MIESKRKRSAQAVSTAAILSEKKRRKSVTPVTNQHYVPSYPQCGVMYSRCRLRLPAYLTLHCYCENTELRHTELLSIVELPETVRDLKRVISDMLSIPIICQLRLSLHDLTLFDDQPFVEEVPLREGDQMKLLYYGKSNCNDYNALIRHGRDMIRFHKYYITRSESDSSSPQNIDNDITDLIQIMDHLFQSILLPWREESTVCHRLYLTGENLIDRVIDIWEWAGDYRSEELSQSCMLVLWDFGENLEERLILMEKNVHKIALDIFIAPGASETLQFGSIGLLAGFGEFPAGQKFLGTNLKFLTKLADYFNRTQDRSGMSIASTLLFTLASHPKVPIVMEKAGTVEHLSSGPLSFTFSEDDLEITYGLILFYMALLRNPKFSLPKGYSPGYFKIKIQQQRNAVSVMSIAQMEEIRGTSWGSILPFIDMLFIPPTASLCKHKNCRGLMDSYLEMAITILSATFMDEQNVKLCLKEDLYGYLVILAWKYKANPRMRSCLRELLTRFSPVINRVPSLLQIACSEHALRFNGLGATLEFIK